MPLSPKRRLALWSALGLSLLAGAAYVKLSRGLRQALLGPGASSAPLAFHALPVPTLQVAHWGGGDVEAVGLGTETTLVAGAFGVAEGGGDLSAGLPTLKASACALWRGRPVVGLEAGGLFLRREGHWEEARSGFGALHVRVLAEAPGGELLIGAREGLFRVAWGAGTLQRVDAAPVKSLALGEGATCYAGGEEGLRRIEGGRADRVATPDPWIEWVGLRGKELWVLTPLGLASGPVGSPLVPVGGGQEARSAAVVGERVYAVGERALLRFDAAGRPAEEFLPAAPRRVFSARGAAFVDTPAGLFHRAPNGWRLARPRPDALPPGPSHVSALAVLGSKVVVGLFDGGLALGEAKGSALTFGSVPGTAAWGVNALLPAGGALFVASLRGAARFDGHRLEPIESGGAGAAFSLASTRDGVAIGYGQGVLLPGSRMISAFHGLPGNQALALASSDQLYVGTPTGLGAVSGSRVAWRVTAGEGKLPHPWVTALASYGDALFVGTYGGGVVRRTVATGTYETCLETGGLKVNPGCLVEAGGRLYLGTDGRGLFRLSADGKRFVALDLPLPSPRVTAIQQGPDGLYVGTDEGLARISFAQLSTRPSEG